MSTEEVMLQVTIVVKYPVPKDEVVRQAIYGTTSFEEAVQIDFENDPASLLMDFDSEIIKVDVT